MADGYPVYKDAKQRTKALAGNLKSLVDTSCEHLALHQSQTSSYYWDLAVSAGHHPMQEATDVGMLHRKMTS